MNDLGEVFDRINALFIRLGFKKVEINGEPNYVYAKIYCIPHYIQRIGFLIEYADSLEGAQKNWYEDGDSFPLEMGEAAILARIEEEIRRNVFGK